MDKKIQAVGQCVFTMTATLGQNILSKKIHDTFQFCAIVLYELTSLLEAVIRHPIIFHLLETNIPRVIQYLFRYVSAVQ